MRYALLLVNHGARPYLGLNALVEGGSSQLSYIEVMNAQHFDGFIDLVPGYDSLFVPLVLYEQRALDAMYGLLKNGRRCHLRRWCAQRPAPRRHAGFGPSHQRSQRAELHQYARRA